MSYRKIITRGRDKHAVETTIFIPDFSDSSEELKRISDEKRYNRIGNLTIAIIDDYKVGIKETVLLDDHFKFNLEPNDCQVIPNVEANQVITFKSNGFKIKADYSLYSYRIDTLNAEIIENTPDLRSFKVLKLPAVIKLIRE